jgi:bacteriocin biosynthesis cyclodehydratase domain-containing protein
MQPKLKGDALLTHRFLKDISLDLPHNLSSTECETYAAKIAFIDSFCDSAASRFERFREHRVLIIGSGLCMSELVHTSLKGGLRQLTVITTSECETNTHRYDEVLDLFYQGDPQQTLTEIDAPHWENEAEVLAALQPFDTILHVSERPMLARASMLNRLCVTHNKNLHQAILIDDHAWIGPLARPDQKGCWECAWRRLQGNLAHDTGKGTRALQPAYAFQDQTTAPLSHFITLPAAALVADRLSFEVFKYLTEAGPVETVAHLVEIDLFTLRTQKHPFMPHPHCRTCRHPVPRTEAQFVKTIKQLEQGEPIYQDLFSKRIAACFETRLGIFHSVDEEDFTQFPLSVCKAVVSNPMPQEEASNPPHVGSGPAPLLGFGCTLAEARRQAILRACEIYSSSIFDQRLLLSSQILENLAIPTERFLSTVPPTKVKEWTWATDLQTGWAFLVPAPLVYPPLRDLSPLSQAGLGLGSGMSWAEALSRALLNVCHYLTITQLCYQWSETVETRMGAVGTGLAPVSVPTAPISAPTSPTRQQPYPQIDLSAIALEPEGIQKRHILELMHENTTVYDVTGPLQIPTFAICMQGKTVAYSTHINVAQALRDGLEQAILHKQLSGEQILADNLPAVPDLPMALRGGKETVGTELAPVQGAVGTGLAPVQDSPTPTAPSSVDEAPQEWLDCKRRLQEILQVHGWRAFAVPLDHDPALSHIQPYIVRVLVARA